MKFGRWRGGGGVFRGGGGGWVIAGFVVDLFVLVSVLKLSV